MFDSFHPRPTPIVGTPPVPSGHLEGSERLSTCQALNARPYLIALHAKRRPPARCGYDDGRSPSLAAVERAGGRRLACPPTRKASHNTRSTTWLTRYATGTGIYSRSEPGSVEVETGTGAANALAHAAASGAATGRARTPAAIRASSFTLSR